MLLEILLYHTLVSIIVSHSRIIFQEKAELFIKKKNLISVMSLFTFINKQTLPTIVLLLLKLIMVGNMIIPIFSNILLIMVMVSNFFINFLIALNKMIVQNALIELLITVLKLYYFRLNCLIIFGIQNVRL